MVLGLLLTACGPSVTSPDSAVSDHPSVDGGLDDAQGNDATPDFDVPETTAMDVVPDAPTPWRTDVPTFGATLDEEAQRVYRLNIVHAQADSGQPDQLLARAYVPRAQNGSGYSVFRSGDCAVENELHPAIAPYDYQFFFIVDRLGEIELSRFNAYHWLTWEDPALPIGQSLQVQWLFFRRDPLFDWSSVVGIPRLIDNLAGIEGINAPTQPTLTRAPGSSFSISWNPATRAQFVHMGIWSEHRIEAMNAFDYSIIHCVVPGDRGSLTVQPWSVPGWIAPGPTGTMGITVDSYGQAAAAVAEGMGVADISTRHATYRVQLVR